MVRGPRSGLEVHLTFLNGALHDGPDVLALFEDTALQLDEEFHPGLLNKASSAQHSVLNILPGQVLSQLQLQGLKVELTAAAQHPLIVCLNLRWAARDDEELLLQGLHGIDAGHHDLRL